MLEPPPRFRPRYIPDRTPPPVKTTTAALIMLVFGTLFLLTGLGLLLLHRDKERSQGFLVLGGIRELYPTDLNDFLAGDGFVVYVMLT